MLQAKLAPTETCNVSTSAPRSACRNEQCNDRKHDGNGAVRSLRQS
jgi:hypothetical protein